MFHNLKPIFGVQDLHYGSLKLNIKARQDIPELLTANPFVNTSYSIGHRLEMKLFLSLQFSLEQQLTNLKKVRT